MPVITAASVTSQDRVLIELAERFLDKGSTDGRGERVVPEPGELANRLSLVDLVGDGQGEIVIEQNEGALVLEVGEDVVLLSQGIASAHVTYGGDEVGGLGFMAFKSGMTVYFPVGLEVSLTPASGHC